MAATNDSTPDIPVVDISSPSTDAANQLLHAASTHGFVFVANYGDVLPPEDIKDMFELVS